MNKPYKVGIYLRLSKEDERLGESGSITNQRAILLNYIKENQLQYIGEYTDDGVSGTTFQRAGFQRMIKDIEEKKINMVITKDTSRLGRDHIEFGYYVEKYFPEHNVRYVAVCDNIDTYFNNNDMLLFKSAYNDMYVKDISNKIRASLNIKKQNGEFVGAYAPYGYKKDPTDKHKLIIEEEPARVVRRIFNLFLNGNSISSICSILTNDHISIPSIYKGMKRGLKSSLFGVWNPRTITDILTNPTYMGNITQGRSKKVSYKSKKRIHTSPDAWIIKENSCPKIIDENLFQMVQHLYLSNKNRYTKQTQPNGSLLLKGLVFCQECNHTIGFRSVLQNTKKQGKVKRIYGNCNYYVKHRQYQACTPHSISYLALEELVIAEVDKLLMQIDLKKIWESICKKELIANKTNSLKKEITFLEKEIELDNKKIDRLYEDKLSGWIDCERYFRMEKKIKIDIDTKQKQLTSLKEKSKNQKQMNYENLFNKWFHERYQDRFFISTLIKKITITENREIAIYFKFKNETFEDICCNTISK